MTVYELNQDQYKQLCQDYITKFWSDYDDKTNSPSWGDWACADELVDQTVIYNYYDGIDFTEDDFFCSKEE